MSQDVKKLFGYSEATWIGQARDFDASSPIQHQLVIADDSQALSNELALLKCQSWAVQRYMQTIYERRLERFETATGFVWAVFVDSARSGGQRFNQSIWSPYAIARDTVGSLVKSLNDPQIQNLYVKFLNISEDQINGSFIGLEMGAYRYTPNSCRLSCLPSLWIDQPVLQKYRAYCERVSSSVNLARHLVNLPACDLNPRSYSEFVNELFKDKQNVSVEIFTEKELLAERMRLLLAVGQASENPARMVRIRYRHPQAQNKPIAFVGKGITFDTGGLDLKPSSGMRLMKKDMGGSASVVGVAYFSVVSQLKLNLDFYLALAENSVSSKSYRPGDIITSRKGLSVEIHNTDAEGRLVLADVMDYAQDQADPHKPSTLIDLSTLTGAMRVAVGTDLIGAFANDQKLYEEVDESGFLMGDPLWRLPLFDDYQDQLKTTVADMMNASAGKYAGGITAALFLKRFIQEKTAWLHCDMMAYHERPRGAISQDGGNGQGVQVMVHWLSKLSKI